MIYLKFVIQKIFSAPFCLLLRSSLSCSPGTCCWCTQLPLAEGGAASCPHPMFIFWRTVVSMMAFLLLCQEEHAIDSDGFFFLIVGSTSDYFSILCIFTQLMYLKINKIFPCLRYFLFFLLATVNPVLTSSQICTTLTDHCWILHSSSLKCLIFFF